MGGFLFVRSPACAAIHQHFKDMDDILMKWSPTKRYFRDGYEFELRVNVALVRYQKNVEYFFSITCDECLVIDGRRAWEFEMMELGVQQMCHGGRDHEFIGKHFPELIPYFDLHLKDRFGRNFGYKPAEIADSYYTEDEKRTIKRIERNVMLRRYLHARELIQLMRSRA